MSDVAIVDFLVSLGLAPADAQRARALLEMEGITNPRKSRISEAKLERAREAIDARFARFCASCAAVTDAQGRDVLTVPQAACTRCGGSRNSRALELRLIDGTERRTRAEAQRDLDWADLIVIGGSSELAHKVSNLYTRAGSPTPVVTAARRGVEAIAAAVVEHARRRPRATARRPADP